MDAEQLALWLEQRLPGISALNLGPGSRVTHVLNWGGFINHSFSVIQGSSQYHLKITDDPSSVERLRRWCTVHSHLEENYRAPKLLEWIEFPEIGFAGLLFERLDGKNADFARDLVLVRQLMDLAERLHRDEEIRSHLTWFRLEKTYLQHFTETYIDRFTSDLETVPAGRLPFVSSTLLAWMQEQTDRLREAASCAPAFQNPAVEAVHGDLNEGNVLVTAKDWFVLDWDDLTIGDPAIDFAVLLWPIVWKGGDWRKCFKSGIEDGFAKRMEICFRAQLLDEVIDPLADYVEARAVPSKLAALQLAKRKRHEEALDRYRRRLWT